MNETSPKGGALYFDLSDRAKFRVCGADRLRFLNGQITNDLRKATEKEAIEACVLDTKGKIDAHLFVGCMPDAYVVDVEADLRTAFPARLERYIIADDVHVEDMTDQFALYHFLGPEVGDLPNEWRILRARRLSQPGFDVWMKNAERDAAARFFSERATFYDAACMEMRRIECGIPRWGQELTDEIIPPEANLEERCIDYDKGCYIGQEVISRMKMSGQTNKRLCGLTSMDGSALTRAMRLKPLEDERDVGWITSAVYSERLQKNIALGFVKRGFNRIGAHLRASSGSAVDVVSLPFIDL